MIVAALVMMALAQALMITHIFTKYLTRRP
jgi:hypothetical protein